MPHHTDSDHALDWRRLLRAADATALAQIQALGAAHQQQLADHFYAHMLADRAATAFLSHAQVQERLHRSMQAWIAAVFGAGPQDDLLPLVQQQQKIGEVHARIDIPMHLVLRGARSLKERMHSLLQPAAAPGAEALVTQIIDLALEVMSQAYASSHDRNSRAKEAYRLFAVTQNVSTERERRRANLLDWENQLMFAHAMGQTSGPLPPLEGSEFGLWFRHKGAHVFQGAPETEAILQGLERIDRQLLPALGQAEAPPAQRLEVLRELRDHTRRIAFHLDALFEHSSELESGRDALTRLLNRKFLPVVLDKEVQYARQSGNRFAVLAIDIDHFKRINDQHGHEAGDQVLQQVAGLLGHHSRGGDYLFRLGGEEFMALLVDVTPEGARRAADKLRQQVASEAFHLPRDQALQVTLSIGVAVFNGHPDYQTLMRRADAALYAAKHGGRNRVVMAED